MSLSHFKKSSEMRSSLKEIKKNMFNQLQQRAEVVDVENEVCDIRVFFWNHGLGAARGGATRPSRQNPGAQVPGGKCLNRNIKQRLARGRGRGRGGKAAGARKRKDSDDAYRTSGRIPLRMGSDRAVAARTRHANNVLYKVDFSDDDL